MEIKMSFNLHTIKLDTLRDRENNETVADDASSACAVT